MEAKEDFYEAGLKKWDDLYPGLNPAVWDDARIEYANAFKAGAEYARTLRTDIKEEIVASLRNKLTPFFNLAAIVIDTDEGVSIDYLKSYADSCNPNEVKELLQQAAQQCAIKDERIAKLENEIEGWKDSLPHQALVRANREKDERIRELEEALMHIKKMDSAWNMREAAERALNPAREALKK